MFKLTFFRQENVAVILFYGFLIFIYKSVGLWKCR